MIDPKSQLNLFARGARPAPPPVDSVAEEAELESVEDAPQPPADDTPPAAPDPVAAEPEPVAEPVAEPDPVVESAAALVAEEPSPDAEEPVSAAVLPGLRPPTGAQYLFPPSDQRRRVDMHFSRRMSDLIRRLQLLERDRKQAVGLTLPQAHAVHALDTAGSLRMQELAATLGLAQSTVTRLVAPLKRMGFLDRRPDRNDGRATRAYLTDRGQLAVDQLEAADRELYRGLLDRIPATRRAEVVAAIELLHDVVLSVARGEE